MVFPARRAGFGLMSERVYLSFEEDITTTILHEQESARVDG